MLNCAVGTWTKTLDAADKKAFRVALVSMSRVSLHKAICAVYQPSPFSLTTLKDHINGRCCCD